ncbi:peptide MFS transporter [Pseudomaricurvus alkylphenolicus]|uniref:peptide MFS transporter n=1 Tax=Pseudomaricurvus alkylphenolicus TaxID=1306991 RepID=UPI001424516C|nr:peptide MFS transporter [Pseudomaricurvus alkylphenolicus]NIB45075.1 peptide MFS transporter [Pseudomaricurvus alkylphenolicus]
MKANISTVVGALYEPEDARRDSGFTTFYMGINIGGALGPLVCGGLGNWLGMRYGFAAAGIGMLVAMCTFLYGQKFLGDRTSPPNPEALRRKLLPGITREWAIYGCALLLVVLVWQALNVYALASGTLLWFAAGLGLFVMYFSIFRCQPLERDRMLVVATLIVFAIIFWSLYMQMFGSLTLFSDRLVDRDLFGVEIAASQLNGLPSVFVITLAPVLSFLWFWLAKRHLNPNIPVKFALSLVLVGLAFMMPSLGQSFSDDGMRISLFWFVMIFVLMVIGELCQAPISMSMITKLCPRRVLGMMMGAYFVSLAIGSIVAGELAARFTQVAQRADGSLVDAGAALDTYASAFFAFGGIAICFGLMLYLLSPFLYQHMHDRDETHGDSFILRFYRGVGLCS